jgi:predicted Fe-S protein YdhL (DUF1289 family)
MSGSSGGTRAVTPVPSPCINVCRMDEATGWCEGCLRTIDEIAAWGSLDDAAKRAVRAELRTRRIAWRERAAAAPSPGPG